MEGQIGELHMTLSITRAATGETETVELVGKLIQEDSTDGGNALDSSQECSN